MIPLKTTLIINAVSSGATGLSMVLFSKLISGIFHVPQPATFMTVGIFLVLFAVYVFSVAVKSSIDSKAVKLIIALDVLWVIASIVIVVLASSVISTIGILTIVLVAVWVAAMAYLQSRGLKLISVPL